MCEFKESWFLHDVIKMFKLKNFQSPCVFYSIIFLSISKTLLLSTISELLRDAALERQPEELSRRSKSDLVWSILLYVLEAKLSDRCLRWVRLRINLYKFGFSKYLAHGKLHRPNLREDIFTPFHFQISGLDLMHGWMVGRKKKQIGKERKKEEKREE